jgi:hypothetical protein
MFEGNSPDIKQTPYCTVAPALQLEAYVADTSPDATLSFNGSMMFIRALFDIVKQLMRKGVVLGSDGTLKIGGVAASGGGGGGVKGAGGDAGTDGTHGGLLLQQVSFLTSHT